MRIAQIDAPEKRQAFGNRSRQALADLCFQQPAAISRTSKDRYGRTVADVACRGQDVGQHMVRGGWAWVYDRYVIDRSLYTLQDAARAARVGLWAAEAVPPWEWRKMPNRAPSSAIQRPGNNGGQTLSYSTSTNGLRR